jgi:hypothetical protein
MMHVDSKYVKIIVFTDDWSEAEKYFKLFRLMFEGRYIQAINYRERKEIYTDKFIIKFMKSNINVRGHRAHYVLNLTQDKEFDSNIARPISHVFEMLRADPKWSALV